MNEPKCAGHCQDCGIPIYEGTDHLCSVREPGGLRDQFAMAALAGLCASEHMTPSESRELAEYAYDHADRMLEARKK